jgi:choline kinase
MAKLHLNTVIDVIIATAGRGSRMTSVNNDLHKGLLPYLDKPILWHLINQIPTNLKIGISTGYKASQIKDFCALIFPERNIQFLDVDDWTSERSGTAYSLICAEKYLNSSFWYIPCDGYFDDSIFDLPITESTFFVKNVQPEDSANYETFDLDYDKKIKSSKHKIAALEEVVAFTGVMKICSKIAFFEDLKKTGSLEFTAVIPFGSKTLILDSWKDLGNENAYVKAINETTVFDFSKPDEFTFILPNDILKWWPSEESAKQKILKPKFNKKVFPAGIKARGEFFSYKKSPGSSYYEYITPENFRSFMKWLREDLWHFVDEDIELSCRDFYEHKTYSRIKLMIPNLNKHEYKICSVDGVAVVGWEEYLNAINWNYLIQKPAISMIHGDLQFDNVIFNPETSKFKLIDWRNSFGAESILGDVYYDLAKILGGIKLNYKLVKENQFSVRNFDGAISLDVPTAKESELLENILRSEVDDLGFDYSKVEQLVPIIYWNMAPLHTEPFALFLWALGMKNFENLK